MYKTTVEYIPAGLLLNATSEGVNHPDVALPGQPVQDGRVALMTVTLLQEPQTAESPSSASAAARPWSLALGEALAVSVPLAVSLVA